MFTWVSAFGGITATRLLSDTDYISQTFLPKFHELLNDRRDYLATILPQYSIDYTPPDAGIFIYVNLQPWLSYFDADKEKPDLTSNSNSNSNSTGVTSSQEIALLEHLMDRGVFLEPGQAFFSRIPGHFRLNYGTEGPKFVRGLGRLLGSLKELDGEKFCFDDADVGIFDDNEPRQRRGKWKLLSCLDKSD